MSLVTGSPVRSNGRAASPAPSSRSRAYRSRGAAPDRSATRQKTASAGCTCCVSTPFRSANVTRNASCRFSIHSSAWRTHDVSSTPLRRNAMVMLKAAEPG